LSGGIPDNKKQVDFNMFLFVSGLTSQFSPVGKQGVYPNCVKHLNGPNGPELIFGSDNVNPWSLKGEGK
jgi:hypothetical protein